MTIELTLENTISENTISQKSLRILSLKKKTMIIPGYHHGRSAIVIEILKVSLLLNMI